MKNKNLQFIEKSKNSFEIVGDDNEIFLEYEYIEKYQLAIHKWHSHLPEEQIIDNYKKLAFFTKENQHIVKASISELSKTQNSFHATNKWVAEEFIPQSIPYGYAYTFFVKPDEFFAELALEDVVDILSKIEGLKEVKVFSNLEEAVEYAKNLPK